MIIATFALALVAAPVAQDHAHAQPTSPASIPATAASPSVARSGKYSVETSPIETLAADPAARVLVAKHLPGLLEHPAYDTFKATSLKALQPFSQGHITDETLHALQADLDAL